VDWIPDNMAVNTAHSRNSTTKKTTKTFETHGKGNCWEKNQCGTPEKLRIDLKRHATRIAYMTIMKGNQTRKL
jgi:hypothetical protein